MDIRLDINTSFNSDSSNLLNLLYEIYRRLNIK